MALGQRIGRPTTTGSWGDATTIHPLPEEGNFGGRPDQMTGRMFRNGDRRPPAGMVDAVATRALQTIDDPVALSTMVSQLATASARTVRANAVEPLS